MTGMSLKLYANILWLISVSNKMKSAYCCCCCCCCCVLMHMKILCFA